MIEKLKRLSKSFKERIDYADKQLENIPYDEGNPDYQRVVSRKLAYTYAKDDLDKIIEEG